MNISDYRPYLSDAVFQHLRNCFMALAEKQYFASAIWGAVFLEAFLGDLASELKIARQGQDDLNGRIQQLRQYSKNHNPGMPDVPDEIVKRCDDIRNTRNRLVHDTGLAKSTLVQDAKFIGAGLRVILDWYIGICPAKDQQSDSSQQQANQGIPVFVSTITPDNQRQAFFLEMLFARLKAIGIQPVRATSTIFDRHDPIGKVRNLIGGCCGLIVIGLERSHAYFLREKEGTEKETEELHRKYTSGWLHLEAGIANALGLDVFVLCQKDICSDGVFDRGWNTYAVTELEGLDEGSPELEGFLDHLKEWVGNQPQAQDIHASS